MTRVIHTGDTHIGYRQYHSPERREDFLAAFEQVVDDAVSEDVDAVVHAGDLFHDRRPDLQDLLGTLSALRTLSDAEIPFLAVVGNHESTRGGQWLDLFENLGLAVRLGADPYVLGDTAFYGLDHVPESRRSELEYEFTPHDADHAALVSHGLFTPFAHANWETETVLTESNIDFDVVLLGDNHKADEAQVDGTWVTYCGSTERASASEEPGRGYNVVTFDDGVDIRRRALDTRPFVFVEVDLAEGEGAERVREQVRQHDLSDAVVIVSITGEGEPVTPASIEEFATERGALIARVKDRREVEAADVDLSVSFADPDDAVRERISEMGLSQAALDIDETVRASKTPDSKVREEVKARVDALVGEDGAFERAPAVEDGDSDTGDTGESGESDTISDVPDEIDAVDGTAEVDDVPEEVEAVADVADDTGEDIDGVGENADGVGETDGTDDSEPATNGQVSMEDFQ